MPVDWNEIKEKIGITAVSQFIPDKGVIGLGSGSTSAFFIKELGKKGGKELLCLSTSSDSTALAKEYKLPIISSEEEWNYSIDITCDGADYIDLQTGIAIKGLGGALVREKIVAQSSKKLLLMVDERKIISPFRQTTLTIPIEIIRFGARKTEEQIQSQLQSKTTRRGNLQTDKPFITDNGNYIIDMTIDSSPEDLFAINRMLISIAGVVETGLFLSYTTDILVGHHDLTITHYTIPR